MPAAAVPSASMQFPLPPPAPPLMIALALPLTLNGLLTQMLDKIGNCGRVTVTWIAVSPRIGCRVHGRHHSDIDLIIACAVPTTKP